MLIVHVFVDVKPQYVDAFKTASIANAKNSIKEPGIARFDVVQDLETPTQFVLVEVYRTDADPAKHKETSHYQVWRDTVAPMMNTPRTARRFNNVVPDDGGWDSE